tara:strand:+ start:1113 stop:1262 length:150 start_codon:yes stop_codon:yes gene_type:complete
MQKLQFFSFSFNFKNVENPVNKPPVTIYLAIDKLHIFTGKVNELLNKNT